LFFLLIKYQFRKLKNDIKTTNLKEIKIQNERLRQELSNALMNDRKIIEAFDKNGMIEQDGYSFYDTNMHRTLSEMSLNKKQELKKVSYLFKPEW
jgi:hypothetical protein